MFHIKIVFNLPFKIYYNILDQDPKSDIKRILFPEDSSQINISNNKDEFTNTSTEGAPHINDSETLDPLYIDEYDDIISNISNTPKEAITTAAPLKKNITGILSLVEENVTTEPPEFGYDHDESSVSTVRDLDYTTTNHNMFPFKVMINPLNFYYMVLTVVSIT